jgi:hypothetical protein
VIKRPQRKLFDAIEKLEKCGFASRAPCRARRKPGISASRVERLSSLICPLSSPLCKNISVSYLVETSLHRPTHRATVLEVDRRSAGLKAGAVRHRLRRLTVRVEEHTGAVPRSETGSVASGALRAQFQQRAVADQPPVRTFCQILRTQGRIAIVTDAGRGMRWTWQRFARDGIAGRVERPVSDQQHADERCWPRTAKSCGPDAPTLASSSRSSVSPTGQ